MLVTVKLHAHITPFPITISIIVVLLENHLQNFRCAMQFTTMNF